MSSTYYWKLINITRFKMHSKPYKYGYSVIEVKDMQRHVCIFEVTRYMKKIQPTTYIFYGSITSHYVTYIMCYLVKTVYNLFRPSFPTVFVLLELESSVKLVLYT